MHHRLLLVPAMAIVAAQYAPAYELQTLEEAQQRLYPNAKLTPFEFKLSPEQFTQLKFEYKVPAFRPLFRGWKVESGGWLYIDQVYGLNDIVTYLIAIGADGKCRGIEVLTCADGYCDLYTPQWRNTLVGLEHGRWDPTRTIPMVSGSTLSATHVAEGVKKMLAVHTRYRPQP
ncbi:MAG: hypothetical protein ACKODA_06350 [Nevskiaceae bacterium]